MHKYVSLFLIVAATALGILLEEVGVQTSFDRALKVQRYAFSSSEPSGDVVLVEIDSQSLRHHNVWPWPRSFHAQTLDVLMEMGAEEVAFDIDFSSYSNLEDDAEFARALEDAGGYAYLASFDQISGASGEIIRSEPNELFAEHAYPVLVNIILDRDGFAHGFPTSGTLHDISIKSLATALADLETGSPPIMHFDFSIDISKVDRISYVDVMEGLVDPARIAGKQIVIGASAVELRDFFESPRFGVLPGPLLQILALETVKSGRVIRDWGYWPSAAIVLVLSLLGGLLRRKLGLVKLAICAAIAVLLWEGIALILFLGFGILLNTMVLNIALPLALIVQVINEAVNWLNQRRVLQDRLQHIAQFDDATGTRTRAGFLEEMANSGSDALDQAIVLIAIKRLDQVRGALGREIADQALKQAAARLGGLTDGPVGLVSQDVFAVGFDAKTSEHGVDEFIESAISSLAKPIVLNEHSVIIDAAAAVATAENGADSFDQVLGNAEIALSSLAATPGQKTIEYQTELSSIILGRQSMDLDLRKAIAQNQFRLAFQPQIDLAQEKLIGVEALIRWHHPEKGIISPVQFIPLAEETGLIVELGEWVIVEACRISAGWNWAGTLAVNVSPVQLELSNVPDIVERALHKTGYPAQQLDIEVTESVLVGDTDRVIADLRAFQDLGCGIAIDDFGTGYSSLSYLSELPFNKLKIDQSFVRFIDQKKGNRAIVESIVHLAKKLDKKIVAEGIETIQEANILKSMECDIGQGYLYGRPVDALTLTKLVTANQSRAKQVNKAS